jgi:hypothetical protein
MEHLSEQQQQVQQRVGSLVRRVSLAGVVVARVGLAGRTHAPHVCAVLVQHLAREAVDALGAGAGAGVLGEVVLVDLVARRVDVEGLRHLEAQHPLTLLPPLVLLPLLVHSLPLPLVLLELCLCLCLCLCHCCCL